MIEITDAQIVGWLSNYLLPLFRIAGFFLAAPIIGSNFVPMRVRLILAVAVTLMIAPGVPESVVRDAMFLELLLIIAQQVLIGVMMGFFLQMMFQVFVVLGQMIAMQMGLGFASMMDPANGVNVAIVSSIYFMMATLLFITFDGHLVMIEVLADSFQQIPVGVAPASDVFMQFVSAISWAFSTALLLALPALTALLMTNFAFGIMTRAAPQLNIFALGFPMALMFGLFVIWLMTGYFLDAAADIFNQMFIAMRALFA